MLKYGLGNDFEGYDKDSTCEFVATTLDPAPHLDIHQENLNIQSNLSIEIKCKQHHNDIEFKHIVNIVSVANIDLTFNVTADLNLVLYVTKLRLKIPSYYDSSVGAISLWRLQLMIDVIEVAARPIMNFILKQGKNINWIIRNFLGINVIEIKELQVEQGEQYIAMSMTPGFKIGNSTWNVV